MKTLINSKKDLAAAAELTDLLGVLKSIASMEYRSLEKKQKRFTNFLTELETFFQMIDFSSVSHPLVRAQNGILGIIIISSDEGFMGGLNVQVVEKALSIPGAHQAKLIVVGRYGAGYLRGLGMTFTEFPGITSEQRYEDALRLKDFVMKETWREPFSRLVMVYPKPVSFTQQIPEVLSILPCHEGFSRSFSPQEAAGRAIMESPEDGIIEYLVETWMTHVFFVTFEGSKLSEFAARTIHLEQSYQHLQEQKKQLHYQYLRMRHEQVDRNMREVFSSQMFQAGLRTAIHTTQGGMIERR